MVHVHEWWMLFGESVVVGDTWFQSVVVFAVVLIVAAVLVAAAVSADAVAAIAVRVRGCTY